MSISQETNRDQVQSVDRLQCEVHEAARRLADAGNAAAKKLREEFGVLREKTLGFVEQGRDKTMHAKDTFDERVRAEPVKSLLIAAAIGAAVGAFFVRRR